MALLTSELRRIKAELGYNVLAAGAEPYIGVHAIFEQVVAVYLTAGASTTSATVVTASSTPAPVALTLASATGFAAGDRVIVDVDDRQEAATVQSIIGSAITVLLSLTHAGTYPVTVEGGESIVREHLARCREAGSNVTLATQAAAGLKSVGRNAVVWQDNANTASSLAQLRDVQMHYRDELASALGVQNLWRVRQGAGLTTSLY